MASRNRNFRSGSRRRNLRRRRSSSRPSNNIFNRKVQRVKNRPYIKPRRPGFGNVTTNITRRLMAYPSSGVQPKPDQPAPKSSWWLDSLSWLSSVALQLIGVFLAGYENPHDGQVKFCVTGAATRIAIDSGFILQSSPLAISQNTNIHIPFEQYRVLWLRFVVTPIVDVARRGGSYACAIIPLDYSSTIKDVDIDFDSVIRQPGSVIRPIDKPCSVSWSPSILEYGLRWHDIANKGDPPMCVFVISFSDLALNKADVGGKQSDEYCPQKAGFEIMFESRVETRRPGLVERNVTMNYSDPTVIKLIGLNRRSEVLFSSVKWDKGLGVVNDTDLIDIYDRHSEGSSCSGEKISLDELM